MLCRGKRPSLAPGSILSWFVIRLIVLFFQLFLMIVEFLALGLSSLLCGSKRGDLGVLGADFSLDGCDLAAEKQHHTLTTHGYVSLQFGA